MIILRPRKSGDNDYFDDNYGKEFWISPDVV